MAGAAATPARPGTLTVALAGDTMLARRVGEALDAGRQLLAPDVLEVARAADLFLLNLECCVSARGEPWTAPGKPFFFRAPPRAADALASWGVDAVTLANNHAMDYGPDALLETLEHLERVGIRWAGAGPDRASARRPAVLHAAGQRVALLSITDHPRRYDAPEDGPGLAYANLREGVPAWLTESLRQAARDHDLVLLGTHWGRNLTSGPEPHVLAAARALSPLATLVWGHSAHVLHGSRGNVLFDTGDFVTDYNVPHPPDGRLRRWARRGRSEIVGMGFELARSVRPAAAAAGRRGPVATLRRRVFWWRRRLSAHRFRPDCGMLFLVMFDGRLARRVEGVPLRLDHAWTRLADPSAARWIARRFRSAARRLGADVREEGGRLIAHLDGAAG